MNTSLKSLALITGTVIMTGCATLHGTVYKSKGGAYTASYTHKNEETVRKAIHADAATTCKKNTGSKGFVVVDEKLESTDSNKGKNPANAALSLAGKFLGTTNMRGTLLFECEA